MECGDLLNTYVLDVSPIQRDKVRGSYCNSQPTRLVEDLRQGVSIGT